ncbi:hypothetical protein ZIOFF_031719 [Zingiber officinale]|uniref:Myb/SANT-like domain-containing protein n=1 Tax=Zingiber officinale TaxID=94328 RepID=A0A8J5GFF7_ZINOF|nr:hypothetical protein ZIOFF_031719 [Zingiber officinale]
MARPPFNSRSQNLMCTLWVTHIILMAVMVLIFYQHSYRIYRRTKICRIKNKEEKRIKRMQWIFSLTKESGAFCISELRMDRRTFEILCDMVRDIGGLKDTRNASVDEIVAFFIYVLAHHKKNRTISLLFHRSQETVSRHFNLCLHAILKLHHILLQTPEPISENCEDDRWKPFKGCLGALDGTFIPVTPPKEEKQRYRTRKGGIATNVLGVCSPNMQFIYVLPGWEGSAHDGRILRDAISRPTGLKVPQGCYYLVDAGYCNSSGFLAPYRGHSMMKSSTVDVHNQETNEVEYGRGKNKRFWTEEESWVLIRCLQDMATDPLWKTDGGFKNNYMNEIRRLMVQKLPQLIIEVKHIDSRIKFLKGRYHAINEMCKQSGCSWNDVEKKIACEFTWYTEWIKVCNFRSSTLVCLQMMQKLASGYGIHKDAKGLYNVSFPYFTDLDMVYGKDRATGDVAEDPLAAEQNLGNATVTLTVTDESDSNTEIEFLSTMESLPSNSSSSSAAKKKCTHQVHKASKKTKFAPVKNVETEYKEFNDEIRGFMKSLDGHLSTMSTWMQGTTSRMPQVLELLEKHGFSGPDKYKASKVICQDPLNIDLLFSLDSTEVREYVLTLI